VTGTHSLVSGAGGRVPRALAEVALTLLVVASAFWVSVAPGVGAQLEYQRGAAGAELLLRGLSGHLVHVGWGHLGWNLLGFLVLGALCERGGRRGFVWATALSAAAIPLALYLVEPGIARYCGLSGLVSALFGILATRAIASHARSGHRALALLTATVAIGFAWRLGWIWIRGDLWLLESTGFQLTPVPLSHAIGLGIGVLVESIESLRGPRSNPALARERDPLAARSAPSERSS
jgi:membrane associated rhomboid family serine protease